MTDTEISYVLNALLSDCILTGSDTNAKVLTPISLGTADEDRIIAEMKEEDSGLRTETIIHVLELNKRVLKRLLLSGYRVNTGIFYGAASLKGTIENSTWDSSRNRIVFNLTASSELRTAAKSTTVNIVAEKGSSAYIGGVQDVQTQSTSGTIGAGDHVSITGRKIKIAGNDESVGISLVDESGTSYSVPSESIVVNDPSNVIFLMPTSVTDGTYTLTLKTQYSCGDQYFLKSPRVIETSIVVE